MRAGNNRPHHSAHEKCFLKRVCTILSTNESEIKNLLANSPYRVFRINKLRSDQSPESIVTSFASLGVVIRPLRWYRDAYIFDAEDTATIQASEAAQSGQIFIQNPSSYLPVLALEPMKDDYILDMCSAPGGKAALIASIAGSSDKLTVNEPKQGRVDKLHEVLKLQGIENAVFSQQDGRHLPQTIDTQFDKVLIDAECSTEAGVNFLSKDPLKGWSEERIVQLSVLQKQLITAGYDLLKPGGILVYATCTFAPEENEAVVASLIERRPDAVVQPMTFNAERNIRKIKSWNGKHFPDLVSNSVLRIFPTDYMEGFFMARIRKPYAEEKLNGTLTHAVSLDDLAKNI